MDHKDRVLSPSPESALEQLQIPAVSAFLQRYQKMMFNDRYADRLPSAVDKVEHDIRMTLIATQLLMGRWMTKFWLGVTVYIGLLFGLIQYGVLTATTAYLVLGVGSFIVYFGCYYRYDWPLQQQINAILAASEAAFAPISDEELATLMTLAHQHRTIDRYLRIVKTHPGRQIRQFERMQLLVEADKPVDPPPAADTAVVTFAVWFENSRSTPERVEPYPPAKGFSVESLSKLTCIGEVEVVEQRLVPDTELLAGLLVRAPSEAVAVRFINELTKRAHRQRTRALARDCREAHYLRFWQSGKPGC